MTTRLKGKRYKEVFAAGKSSRGRFLVAWSLADGKSTGKAGVVVSKRSFHHAVDRNRAKRLMREAFRLLAKEGASPALTDWVFVGRVSLGSCKCQDVMADMRKVFSRRLEVAAK